MKLDGKPYSRLWLDLDQLTHGATVEFEMGKSPNTGWATAESDAPPSFDAQ